MVAGGLDRVRRRYTGGIELSGAQSLTDISLSCRLVAEDPTKFVATLWTTKRDGVMLTRFRSTPLTSYRTTDRLNDHYGGFVQIGIVLEGGVTAVQEGRTAEAHPGDILVLLLDRPFEVRNTGDVIDVVQLYVRSEALRVWGIDPLLIAGRSWTLGSVDRSAVDLVQQIAISAPDGDPLVDGLVPRLAMLLLRGAADPAAESDPHTWLRRRAIEYIDRSFDDPRLGPASLAQALGTSRRQLYRAFEGSDVSVSALIRSRRLDRVASLLAAPGSTDHGLSRIARECGFAGPDQMSRAFRAVFGMSPGKYRAGSAD